MELLLTGKKIKADEAQKLGLINYVVPRRRGYGQGYRAR